MRRSLRLALPGALAAVTVALGAVPATAADAPQPLALGAYIPGASEDPHRIDAFAGEAGRRPVVVLSYKDWSSLPFDRAELDSIWRRGAVPMITWEPWTSNGRGFPLREIAAKRFDRYLRRAAGSARLWGRPLFVRFAQEMNGDWFPWGRGDDGDTARDFRKAWKHVVDLFRFHGATNVIWVWSPNQDSGGDFQLAPFYPGDEWVDWVALDGFNFGGRVGWPSFTTLFASSYDRVAAITNRPMMIAETGANEDGGDKAAWVLSALGREAPRFPRLRSVIWFDAARPEADFRIDSSTSSLRAFRHAASSPAFAASRGDLLDTPASLSGGTLAPAEPDGGYGAPSFLERLRLKLHGAYLWLAVGLAVLGALALAALVAMHLLRSRRAKAPV
jgi:hypothetical protein